MLLDLLFPVISIWNEKMHLKVIFVLTTQRNQGCVSSASNTRLCFFFSSNPQQEKHLSILQMLIKPNVSFQTWKLLCFYIIQWARFKFFLSALLFRFFPPKISLGEFFANLNKLCYKSCVFLGGIFCQAQNIFLFHICIVGNCLNTRIWKLKLKILKIIFIFIFRQTDWKFERNISTDHW